MHQSRPLPKSSPTFVPKRLHRSRVIHLSGCSGFSFLCMQNIRFVTMLCVLVLLCGACKHHHRYHCHCVCPRTVGGSAKHQPRGTKKHPPRGSETLTPALGGTKTENGAKEGSVDHPTESNVSKNILAKIVRHLNENRFTARAYKSWKGKTFKTRVRVFNVEINSETKKRRVLFDPPDEKRGIGKRIDKGETIVMLAIPQPPKSNLSILRRGMVVELSGSLARLDQANPGWLLIWVKNPKVKHEGVPLN